MGRSVVRLFAAAGWDVLALASRPGVSVDQLDVERAHVSRISVLVLDIASPTVGHDTTCLGHLDDVVHLAAIIPGASTIPDDHALAQNISMVRWALRVAEQNEAALVLASSAFIHDWQEPPPYNEQSGVRPLTSYYRGKIVAEELCSAHRERTGLPVSCLRISAPYGPGSRHRTVLTTFVDAALAGTELRYYGTGGRTQDFVHFSDVAAAFQLALASRASGAFLIASGRSISMRELAERIVALSPVRGARVVATGEPDPQEGCRWEFDCSHARHTFGYRPRIALDAGLSALLHGRTAT